MKALCIYLAIAAVAVNVVGNWANGKADAIEQQRAERTERLCQVNRIYC